MAKEGEDDVDLHAKAASESRDGLEGEARLRDDGGTVNLPRDEDQVTLDESAISKIPDGQNEHQVLEALPRDPSDRRRFRIPKPEAILPRILRTRLGRASRYVAIGVIVLVLGGVSASALFIDTHFVGQRKQPVERFASVVVPFRVVSTTPSPDQHNVADGSKIVVTFSRAVDPNKMNGDFFVSPQVSGTYSAGANNKQIVFTPVVPFPNGTIVNVMIHGEFQGIDGTQLGADYSFSYTMATPSDGVIFQRNDFQDVVGSVPVGETPDYTLLVGNDVNSSGAVTVYKSDMTTMLHGLVYGTKAGAGGGYRGFVNEAVDTSTMQSVQTMQGLKDQTHLKVTQGEGVYAIVATSGGKQVGYTWLVVGSLGVVARQDDQQLVLAAQDFASQDPADVNVTLYSLNGSVKQLSQADINGSGSMPTTFNPGIDAAVVKDASGHEAFIPLAEYLSLADLRVKKDLSASNLVYGLTDKPTYGIGEDVQYAGYVRSDNDAQYQVPNIGTVVRLYVAQSPWSDQLESFNAFTDANGMIHGNFNVGSSFVPSGQASQQLFIYAAAAGDGSNDQPIASFTATTTKASSDNLRVTFGKSEYIASDTINASLVGNDANGAPLAGATVIADIYAKTYYEGNASSNQASLGSLGTKLTDTPLTIHLDGAGHATVPIDVSKFPSGNSQVVTVQASTTDPGGVIAGGGASVVVHQGSGLLSFGTGRTVVAPGGQIVARVYAKTLSGGALSGAQVNYKLIANTYDTSSQTTKSVEAANGQVSADGSGFAEISQAIASTYTSATTFDLQAWTSDASNNKISADSYYYVRDPNGSTSYSDLQAADLDISGAPKDVAVGQTLHLTINSAQDVHALVTLERGRIHKYETIDLKKGNNSYTVVVTPELAPSFGLTFSYIKGGQYQVEGVTYTAIPADKLATLTLATDLASYAAGATATITLNAQDSSGSPLQTNAILGVVDANVFNFSNQVTPDIFTFMFGPREMTTNGSSSLTGLGSGGGKCGGGGWDQPGLTNPLGGVLLWNPSLKTDANGNVSVQVKLPRGSWRVYAYTMNASSVVGSGYMTVNAQ